MRRPSAPSAAKVMSFPRTCMWVKSARTDASWGSGAVRRTSWWGAPGGIARILLAQDHAAELLRDRRAREAQADADPVALGLARGHVVDLEHEGRPGRDLEGHARVEAHGLAARDLAGDESARVGLARVDPGQVAVVHDPRVVGADLARRSQVSSAKVRGRST